MSEDEKPAKPKKAKAPAAPPPSAVKAMAVSTSRAMQLAAGFMTSMDEASPEEFAQALTRTTQALCGMRQEIDLFGATRNRLEAIAEEARAKAKWLTERARAIESMIEAADAQLISEVSAQPEMPLAGEAYRLKVVNNGGKESLDIKLARDDGTNPVREKVYLSNVIDKEFAFVAELPKEFLIEETYVRLNTDAIRAALDAGQKLAWAKLERGQRLAVKDL